MILHRCRVTCRSEWRDADIAYTVQQIKLLAFKQSAPPQDLDLAEQILYLTLSDIYRRFRLGDISPSEGDRLFKAAARDFDRNSAKVSILNRIASHQAEQWKQIEAAAAAYMMSGNRTPEADDFVEAVYQCKLKQKGIDANDT